jgi:hypothetical protein
MIDLWGCPANLQPVRLAGGWRLVLICSERKVLLAGCWWLVCSERKVLVAGGCCLFVLQNFLYQFLKAPTMLSEDVGT